MIPYYFTCLSGAILSWSFVVLKNGSFPGVSLQSWIGGVLLLKSNYEQMAMWFLPALFVGKILFYIFCKIDFQKIDFIGPLCLLSFFLGLFLHSLSPEHFDTALFFENPLTVVIFLYIGKKCYDLNIFYNKFSSLGWFFVLLFIGSAWMFPIDMRDHNYPNGVFSIISSSLISISFIKVCKIIDEIDSPVIKCLQFPLIICGRHSLLCLCLQGCSKN